MAAADIFTDGVRKYKALVSFQTSRYSVTVQRSGRWGDKSKGSSYSSRTPRNAGGGANGQGPFAAG